MAITGAGRPRPAICTAGSLANLDAFSINIMRAQLPSMAASISEKPSRSLHGRRPILRHR